MPKVPMNYSNTIIYKIVCKDVDIKECYVGQTTNFSRRKSHHKSKCNNINSDRYNCYVYQFIRENGGFDNWDMIEIEKYNAIDKLDAGKRERYWIETLEAKLNINIPTKTQNEWIENNKKYLQEYKKTYYIENIDDIKITQKDYNTKNKTKINERNKKYYNQHKNKIILQKKLKYQLKKEAQA